MWEQNEKKIFGSTVSTVRNWSGSSWLLQSTGAPCTTMPLPPLVLGTAWKGHPEEAGLNGSSPLRTGDRISGVFAGFQLEGFLMQMDSLLAIRKAVARQFS